MRAPLRHGLCPPRGVAREQLLVGRREPCPAGLTRLGGGYEPGEHRGVAREPPFRGSGRQREGPGQRAVGPCYIAGRDGEAAERVPGGGVRGLLVLENGVREESLRLSELLVARLGLLRRAAQRSYRVADLGVRRRQLAGRLGGRPSPLGRKQSTRREREGQEGQEGRCGTHGGLEMTREGPGVNSRKT